ncbi:MAG: hypothetical protein Q9213_002292 [Squamulea squamosa]
MVLVTITRIAGVKKNGHIDSVWTSYFTIVAAEIGILLASVSTYRAFFVSYRKGEDDNKAKNKAASDQEHWYDSKKELLKGLLTLNPRRTRTRGKSTPDEGSGDQGCRFDIGKLPDIPRAQMTGVRTFINGRGRDLNDSNVMESAYEEEPYDPDGSHAATIPTGSTLSTQFPNTNQSLIEETLRLLNRYEGYPNQEAALQTFRPWPAPPFNFRSTTQPSWFLRIISYDSHRLTFRQMHAMVSICYEAEEFLKSLDPEDPMEARTYVFRATQREPYDLTREDVEVVFFNAAEEPGTAYKASDMYMALDIMLGRMLPQHLPDMTRTVVHCADMELRNGARMKFRKVSIRRKTDDRGNAVATA